MFYDYQCSFQVIAMNAIVSSILILIYHILIGKRSKNERQLKQNHYDQLIDIDEQQQNQSLGEFQITQNSSNILSSEALKINLQQFSQQVDSSNQNVNFLLDKIQKLELELSDKIDKIKEEYNTNQQQFILASEQFSILQSQFNQLKVFFEGKITEQIQIYSKTTSKLEQLDDLSQHFQTQISLVKQEQTKEMNNLNDKICDFNSNLSRSIIELNEQINNLKNQQVDIDNLKQQQNINNQEINNGNNSNQIGFKTSGMTRQTQEIGQLKKSASTYKKMTKLPNTEK